jgi:mannose-6-phosphate isomerase-like protein (cupin superfamily)
VYSSHYENLHGLEHDEVDTVYWVQQGTMKVEMKRRTGRKSEVEAGDKLNF